MFVASAGIQKIGCRTLLLIHHHQHRPLCHQPGMVQRPGGGQDPRFIAHRPDDPDRRDYVRFCREADLQPGRRGTRHQGRQGTVRVARLRVQADLQRPDSQTQVTWT